jgi:tetratricopeptide (TPR) repeat protein
MLSGDYAKAAADLTELLARDRRCSWGYGWRGECLVKLGKLREALKDLEDATNLDPRYGDAWAWLAEARRQSGDAGGALAAAERALEGNGDKALAHLIRGMARGAQGDAAGQVEDFKKAAALRPALLGEAGAKLLST